MTTTIKKTPPFPYDYFPVPSQRRKTTIHKKENRQQAVNDILAILQEYHSHEDSDRTSVIGEITRFLQEGSQQTRRLTQPIQPIKTEPEIEDNADEDWNDVFYNESESPEIVDAFISMIKSIPITEEQSYSIYSDEELDEF